MALTFATVGGVVLSTTGKAPSIAAAFEFQYKPHKPVALVSAAQNCNSRSVSLALYATCFPYKMNPSVTLPVGRVPLVDAKPACSKELFVGMI